MKAGKWAATKFIKALLPSQPLGNQNYNELKKQNMKTATCCPTKKGQTTKRMNPRHKRSTTTLSGCVLEAPAPGPDPGASAPPSWALPSRTSGAGTGGRHQETLGARGRTSRALRAVSSAMSSPLLRPQGSSPQSTGSGSNGAQ